MHRSARKVTVKLAREVNTVTFRFVPGRSYSGVVCCPPMHPKLAALVVAVLSATSVHQAPGHLTARDVAKFRPRRGSVSTVMGDRLDNQPAVGPPDPGCPAPTGLVICPLSDCCFLTQRLHKCGLSHLLGASGSHMAHLSTGRFEES